MFELCAWHGAIQSHVRMYYTTLCCKAKELWFWKVVKWDHRFSAQAELSFELHQSHILYPFRALYCTTHNMKTWHVLNFYQWLEYKNRKQVIEPWAGFGRLLGLQNIKPNTCIRWFVQNTFSNAYWMKVWKHSDINSQCQHSNMYLPYKSPSWCICTVFFFVAD